MKKWNIYFFSCLLLCIVGCKPVNPPSNDDITTVINLCYSGMGQSGEKLQENLADIGINVPYIGTVDQYECYEIKNKSFHLSFSSLHDSIVIVHYEFFFKSTFVEGLSKYTKVSDQLVGFGWNKWIGRSPKNEFSGIENRPEFFQKATEEVAAAKSAQLRIRELVESPTGNKYLHGEWFYWGTDPVGMDRDTGEGLSDNKDSSIGIDITVDEWNFEDLYE